MVDLINSSPWMSGIIIFVTQILFLYFRTLNVMYTAEHKVWPSILTGQGIGLTWLLSVSIGANAIMNGEIAPVICYLIGGGLGTYLGFKNIKFNKNERKGNT